METDTEERLPLDPELLAGLTELPMATRSTFALLYQLANEEIAEGEELVPTLFGIRLSGNAVGEIVPAPIGDMFLNAETKSKVPAFMRQLLRESHLDLVAIWSEAWIVVRPLPKNEAVNMSDFSEPPSQAADRRECVMFTALYGDQQFLATAIINRAARRLERLGTATTMAGNMAESPSGTGH